MMKSSSRKIRPVLFILVLIAMLLSATGALALGVIGRASIATGGTQAIGGESKHSALSSNGRYLVFSSGATNLVANDTNGVDDVFVHDRTLNTTTRVSVGTSGTEANGASTNPTISSNGRYIAFLSSATNLVAGDSNGYADIFVYDLTLSTTTIVSIAAGGTQATGNSSGTPSISDDGNKVVFTTQADNLDATPISMTNRIHLYLRNISADTTTCLSVNPAITQKADGDSAHPHITRDGNYVVFSNTGSNLVAAPTIYGQFDIYFRDINTNTTTLLTSGANNHSYCPAISNNGRYISFHSYASNLITGDTNAAGDVFVHDRTANTTERVSLSSSGIEGDGSSNASSISGDGRYVSFMSSATNLVPGDTNGVRDTFVYDRNADTITRFSVASNGEEGNGISGSTSGKVVISEDGLWVTFQSAATNLVSGDTNGQDDIFVSEVDFTSPIVSGNSLAASYANGNGPSSFTLTYNKAMTNPAGNTNTADVTNPVNYLLVEAGANSVFDTSSCSGGLTGDDTQIVTDSVTYTSGTYTVDVNINGGTALTDGSYKLFVCGTTSVYDGAGNVLNGWTAPRTDHTINFTVAAMPAPVPASLPATGFAMGRVTTLNTQPENKAYTETTMMLEIPKIGVEMPIVGVPQSESGWDVNWLGNSAGYLAGSAFPTWAGNTVITGHVWDAYNNPGIFAELKTLKYGDQVQIHAWGQTYTYEVRESNLVTTKNVSAVLQSEEYDWVTLVTCEFYNPFTGDYLFRRAVRAVLVSVK